MMIFTLDFKAMRKSEVRRMIAENAAKMQLTMFREARLKLIAALVEDYIEEFELKTKIPAQEMDEFQLEFENIVFENLCDNGYSSRLPTINQVVDLFDWNLFEFHGRKY